MLRKIVSVLLLNAACCCSAFAQAASKPIDSKPARDRLYAAHALYYTPTASGLKSFHCQASIPWKEMLERFGKTDIPDDNPFLKYLQTVHLSVSDELNGKGTLEWSSTGIPPEGKEQSAAQFREGMQTTVGGFFQAWNVYMNGGMVPLPDDTVAVTTAGAGVHFHTTSGGTTVDEDFDKNMLLTKVDVLSPEIKVVQTPTYMTSADGLIVTSIASQINQPPTASQTEATMRVDYADANSFHLPSHVVFDIKNTGVIEIAFSNCQVSLAEGGKKP